MSLFLVELIFEMFLFSMFIKCAKGNLVAPNGTNSTSCFKLKMAHNSSLNNISQQKNTTKGKLESSKIILLT